MQINAMSISENPNRRGVYSWHSWFMQNIIPFQKPQVKERTCSFCGAKESKVDHMFNGQPGVNICGSCAQYAKKRLDESTNDK